MKLILSNSSPKPIYEQILDQLKECILSGELQSSEMLPSIRALAKDLKISVITTKRAYDELEKDGFITTVAGKGCFVAEKNHEYLKEEILKRIENSLVQAIMDASKCQLSKKELIQMLEALLEEENYE